MIQPGTRGMRFGIGNEQTCYKLFMLLLVDGIISAGATDNLGVYRDFRKEQNKGTKLERKNHTTIRHPVWGHHGHSLCHHE